jgi:hypothetical protein
MCGEALCSDHYIGRPALRTLRLVKLGMKIARLNRMHSRSVTGFYVNRDNSCAMRVYLPWQEYQHVLCDLF